MSTQQFKGYDDLRLKKTVLFSEQARRELYAGADLLTNAARITLGPLGSNVGLGCKEAPPALTRDGVTTSESLVLEHPHRNMGVQFLRQAATATQKIAGDGSTTTIVLAHAILREGLKLITAGANPLLFQQGLLKGAAVARLALTKLSRPLETMEETVSVATLAASDPKIGELVCQVVTTLGKDGLIWTQEYEGVGVEVELVRGMYWKDGYVSPGFVTDEGSSRAVLEDVAVLVTDRKLSHADELIPIMEQLARTGQSTLLVIAEEVTGSALATLVINKQRGAFKCLAVKPPAYGELRKAMLQDIAIWTGATLFNDELGRPLQTATLDDLGQVSQVIATHNRTTLTEGNGSTAAIEARIQEIRTLIEQTEDEQARDKLQQRLAALAGGFATIRVGGYTTAHRKERQRRLNKAFSAVRGAVEEGILPGGGVALLDIIPALEAVKPESEDEAAALRCLQRAFEVPLRQLAINAGQDGGAVVGEVRRLQQMSRNPFIGYDVVHSAFGDLREWGILDATRVVRTVVLNAVSAASTMLTVEASVGITPGQPIRFVEPSETLVRLREERKAAMQRRRRLGKQKPPRRVWGLHR